MLSSIILASFACITNRRRLATYVRYNLGKSLLDINAIPSLSTWQACNPSLSFWQFPFVFRISRSRPSSDNSPILMLESSPVCPSAIAWMSTSRLCDTVVFLSSVQGLEDSEVDSPCIFLLLLVPVIRLLAQRYTSLAFLHKAARRSSKDNGACLLPTPGAHLSPRYVVETWKYSFMS